MGIKDVQLISKNTEGLIHELALAQEVNKESIDWVFRNSTSLGPVLCKVYDIKDEGLKRCRDYEQLVNNKEWMEVIAEHEKVMGLILESQYLWDRLFESETAFRVLLESEFAMGKVFGSTLAMNSIVESEDAVRAVLKGDVSKKVLYTSTNAVKAMAGNKVSWKIIQDLMENDSVFLNEIFNTATVINGIMGTSLSMREIADSTFLMEAIVSSAKARTALYDNRTITENLLGASSNALSIMKSSSQYQEVSGYAIIQSTATKTIYSGKAFVFEVWANYNSCNIHHGNYSVGAVTITSQLSKSKLRVNKFASVVATGSSENSSGMATSNHSIFKI